MTPRIKLFLFDTTLTSAVLYLWVLPFWKPRGNLGWNHYRFLDIYLGLPIAMFAIGRIAVALVPRKSRRIAAYRAIALIGSSLISVSAIDLAVVAWRTAHWDFWLDSPIVERTGNRADAELGWVRLPNQSWSGKLPSSPYYIRFRTDENGFRNPPGGNDADVIFLGDADCSGRADFRGADIKDDWT